MKKFFKKKLNNEKQSFKDVGIQTDFISLKCEECNINEIFYISKSMCIKCIEEDNYKNRSWNYSNYRKN